MKPIPLPPLTAAQKEKYDILFPPLPSYSSPQTFGQRIKYSLLSLSSFFLSSIGIFIFSLCALPTILINILKSEPPRPFQASETTRAANRRREEDAWETSKFQKKHSRNGPDVSSGVPASILEAHNGYLPTEGGKDEFRREVGYYARRVGLDCEEIRVETEDGFVLDLWHIFDVGEYVGLPAALRGVRGPENISAVREPSRKLEPESEGGMGGSGGGNGRRGRKFPVLMIHGLLQSAGVYATNDEYSLAFWMVKEGFDVWLGNCRAGFEPRHVELSKSDPGMWNWDCKSPLILLPLSRLPFQADENSETYGNNGSPGVGC
jgi:hypothetical protein